MTKAGHNSNQAVKALVERIERLEQDKADIASDIRDVYAEAKSNGHDVKALRLVIRRRKMDAEKRRELDEMVEVYEGVFA
jgi:uncharacterized protein (UPF0335 family)